MSKKIPTCGGPRKLISQVITAMFIVGLTTVPLLADQPVQVSLAPGDIHDVNVQVEYDGSVIVFSKGDQEQQDRETVLPLEVRARLAFEQQAVLSPRQAIRHYRQAKAKIQIDQQSHESVLDQHNQNLGIFLAGSQSVTKPVLFSSELDILKQSELELVTTPFDFLTLPSFLSKSDAKINTPWQPRDQDVVNVLAINRLYTNEIKLTVKQADARQTKIYITGSASGEVDGEDIRVTLSGVALIDNTRNCVQSVRVTIDENRGAGQIAPGFEGTVKLDLKATPKKAIESIPAPVIARARKFRQQKLAWKPDNSFKLYFDPRWRLITDEDQAAVMRLLDNGDLLAQCNIVQLPNRPQGNLLKLEEFQEEISKIIDGSNAKVEGSKSSETSRGLNVLQVQVLGEEDQIPIRWVYYHVAHEDGRRLTFVFTVEDEVYDRFSAFGRSLIESLMFEARKKEATASTGSGRTTRK